MNFWRYFSQILSSYLPGWGKIRGERLLALDIGTEFVKALIFKIDSNKRQGSIQGIGRQRQAPSDMQAGAVANIEGVINTCQLAIEQAGQMAGIKPKQVIMGICGEFVKGATTSLIYQREKAEEKIDLAELKNIVQKIQWKAFDKIRKDLAWESGRPEIEIKLINAVITEVRIDGYRVTNPLGFQGKEICLTIFNVYAPLIHLGALQTIASKLNLDLISIAAEPYALARSLYLKPEPVDSRLRVEDGQSQREAILIDLGGGTTDIALVRRAGVESTKSLAIGGRAFTKRLMQELGLGFTEAEEIKIKYSRKQLSLTVRRRIREIFKKDINVWLSGVELALVEFSQTELFPPRILLCGGASLLPGIKKNLEGKWTEGLSFTQSPRVSFISAKDITDIIDETNQAQEPQDIVVMALASLALELINQKGVLTSIAERAVRIIQK